MSTNKNGMERWNDLQKKYEESQELLSKAQRLNEDLTQKMSELKDLNSQLDYSWGNKCENLNRDREM